MINLDDRLIKEVSPKIKPNALSVLLAIAIHLNKQNGRCFPSHRRLMDLTGLGRDAVYSALEVLKKEGLLKSFQAIDSKTKSFGRRTFTVSTRFISIFVTAEDAEPLPENPDTAEPDTAEPDTAEPDTANQETKRLNELERLNQLEQLNKVGESTPAHAEISNTLEEEKNKRGLVAPPPAEAAAPDLLVKLYRPETPGMIEAEGIALTPMPRVATTIEAENKISEWIAGEGLQTVKYRYETAKERFDPEQAPAIAAHYCSVYTKNPANKERLLKDPVTHFSDGLFSYIKSEQQYGRQRAQPGPTSQKPFTQPDQPSPKNYMPSYS